MRRWFIEVILKTFSVFLPLLYCNLWNSLVEAHRSPTFTSLDNRPSFFCYFIIQGIYISSSSSSEFGETQQVKESEGVRWPNTAFPYEIA